MQQGAAASVVEAMYSASRSFVGRRTQQAISATIQLAGQSSHVALLLANGTVVVPQPRLPTVAAARDWRHEHYLDVPVQEDGRHHTPA